MKSKSDPGERALAETCRLEKCEGWQVYRWDRNEQAKGERFDLLGFGIRVNRERGGGGNETTVGERRGSSWMSGHRLPTVDESPTGAGKLSTSLVAERKKKSPRRKRSQKNKGGGIKEGMERSITYSTIEKWRTTHRRLTERKPEENYSTGSERGKEKGNEGEKTKIVLHSGV